MATRILQVPLSAARYHRLLLTLPYQDSTVGM
jgi:hypothetical protein